MVDITVINWTPQNQQPNVMEAITANLAWIGLILWTLAMQVALVLTAASTDIILVSLHLASRYVKIRCLEKQHSIVYFIVSFFEHKKPP